MNVDMPQQPGMPGGISTPQPPNQFVDGMMTPQGFRQMPQSAMQGQLQQNQQQPSQQQHQQPQPSQGFMNFPTQQGQNLTAQNNQPSMHPQQMMRPPGANTVFTPQENHAINRLAQQLAARATPQEKEDLLAKLRSMSQQQRDHFRQQNVDPLFNHFRQKAVSIYNQKKREVALASGSQQGNNAQNVVNGQQPQHMGMQGSHQGNHQINQIMDQQQNAFREAAKGETVVPASQPQDPRSTPQQMTTPEPSRAGQAQMGFINRKGPNLVQRQEQMTPNPNAQRNQQGNVMGQVGGTNGPVTQRQPQPSPVMPNINRPHDPTMQRPPSQNASQNRPQQQIPQSPMQGPNPQSTPHMNQPSMQGERNMMPGNGVPQQRPMQIPPNIPPAIQHQLMKFPPEKRGDALMAMRQRHLQMQSQMQIQNRIGQNQGPRQTGQMPQMAGGPSPHDLQMQGRPGHLQTPMSQAPSVPQPSSAGVAGNAQGLGSNQPRGPPQPMNALPNQKPAMNIASTDDQERSMDRLQLPQTMFNHDKIAQKIPPQVKSWGELKNWVMQNPKDLGADDMLAKLERQQKQEEARKQREQAGMQAMPPSTQAPSSMAPGPAPPAPMMGHPGQPRDGGFQAMFRHGIPPQFVPTPEEITNLRAKKPNIRDFTDDHIRANVAKLRMAFAERSQMANGQMPNGQPGIAQMAPQGQAMPMMNQAAQGQSQPPTARQPPPQTPTNKPTPQQPVIGVQPTLTISQSPSQPAATPKGEKKASSDDVQKMADPATTTRKSPGNMNKGGSVMQRPNTNAAAQAGQTASTATKPQPNSTVANDQKREANVGLRQNPAHTRFSQVWEEVERSVPFGPIVPMDENVKGQLHAYLRIKAVEIIRRSKQGLYEYCCLVGNINEQTMKSLIHQVSTLQRSISRPPCSYETRLRWLRGNTKTETHLLRSMGISPSRLITSDVIVAPCSHISKLFEKRRLQ